MVAKLDSQSRPRAQPQGKAVKKQSTKNFGAERRTTDVNRKGWYNDRSGEFAPVGTKRMRDLAAAALNRGSLVLDISGRFVKVSLAQRLKFKNSDVADNGGSHATRFRQYAAATTLRKALEAGALPDDISYDAMKGQLEFINFRAKTAPGPLPQSQWPPGCAPLDTPRPFWLPEDWAYGVRTTCKSYLPVYIAPNGLTYFHRPVIEEMVQQQLGGVEGMQSHVRKQVLAGHNWAGKRMRFQSDSRLFACLSRKERKHLPRAEELHFCVVSARRTSDPAGLRGICNVQAMLTASGGRPRWFVDEASIEDYRSLGLDAVVGGKLTPSRNAALADSQRHGKACVQVSDDIMHWHYQTGKPGSLRVSGLSPSDLLKHANAAAKSLTRLEVSPVAAARFILAKMRAADVDGSRPRLGGVSPTGNAAQSLLSSETSSDGFILGDFFVHDHSPVRFDVSMTLKEDYDFTCAHIEKHGSILRCNRMLLSVAHETNPGGAVAVRDASGKRERENIEILMRKWPGVFKPSKARGDTQVTMRWSCLKKD